MMAEDENDNWLWCIECKRAFQLSQAEKQGSSGHCVYPDCDGVIERDTLPWSTLRLMYPLPDHPETDVAYDILSINREIALKQFVNVIGNAIRLRGSYVCNDGKIMLLCAKAESKEEKAKCITAFAQEHGWSARVVDGLFGTVFTASANPLRVVSKDGKTSA